MFCILQIEEQFGSSFYINPYQTQDLLRLGETSVLTVLENHKVDFEKPEYLAAPVRFRHFLAFTSNSPSLQFKFPFHLRHQFPNNSDYPDYTTKKISLPISYSYSCHSSFDDQTEASWKAIFKNRGCGPIAEQGMDSHPPWFNSSQRPINRRKNECPNSISTIPSHDFVQFLTLGVVNVFALIIVALLCI